VTDIPAAGVPVPEPPLTVRSLMFVPGGRPDMVAKMPRWSPDVTVVDLEDAVAHDDKDRAREAAVAAITELAAGPGRGLTVLVRVNPPGTPWFAADVAAAAGSPAAGVVLPKLEDPGQAGELRSMLAAHGRGDATVIAGLETARGVADSRKLLACGLAAAYFGAEDYIADLGGRRTPGGQEVLFARSQVVLSARLSGVPAIDQAVVAVRDEQGFSADAEAGRSLGYTGKICLHPQQVAQAHRIFTPSAEEAAHARAVLAAARAGVAVVEGEMVDEVHVKMATAVLRRAGERSAEQQRAGEQGAE
jgi:citrate lyase subunit beta / citryl-CoA lyase